MDKDHKDPYKLYLTKPRLASYKQKKWKRHQDTVYLGRYTACATKSSIKQDVTQSSFTIHSQLVFSRKLL